MVDDSYFAGIIGHGQKIQRAAEAKGMTPIAYVDDIVSLFQQLWKKLNISNDDFIRTTEKRHEIVVQDLMQKSYDNGDIYKSEYEGWYCTPCETFWPENKLPEGKHICPDCGRPLELVKEESYFLKMSKYADRWLAFIDENPDFIQPESRRNEMIAFVKSGLEDLCVSRTSFDWGIKVPWDPKHGIGWCAPQQGACKLTLNVKEGIIEEALVETIGCSGMTHSAAMASEILPGKTLLEALNTDLVCDAINVAMRELFLQIVYGRTQTAFSEGGLPIGASLDDLGKGMRSQIGTMFGTKKKGTRYLELTEGYVTRMALDEEKQVIGYEFIHLGKMMEAIKKGIEPAAAMEKAKGQYGRFDEADSYIDPREQ